MTIHWCGTGLSTRPGLRRLIREGRPVTVWNRTLGKAVESVGDLTTSLRAFDEAGLAAETAAGDVIVSMLPATHHEALARLAIDRGAHFVSSSYVAPGMAALDGAARAAGVALVGEVGLDPGLDHLMAHWLVRDYRESGVHREGNVLSFTSYCGGIPLHPNPFRYKFSWSPLGVLKALRAPSLSLRDGAQYHVARPWDALDRFTAPLPTPETFEVYPNRDSLPFIAQYGFDPAWKLRDFVRGTLRLEGWGAAWADLFAEIETLDGEAGEAQLTEIAEDLWQAHAYAEDEPDRVVLFVTLAARDADGRAIHHKTWALDARGDGRGSAMGRLVSHPVALAAMAAADGMLAPGVQTVPTDADTIEVWLNDIREQAQHMALVDHLTET